MNVENAAIRKLPSNVQRTDARVVRWLQRVSLPLLRVALGIVFVWFGALKVLGVTPVADLVRDVLAPFPLPVSVVGLGWIEILVGLGLVTMLLPRVTMLLFVVQMLGTFLVFVVTPGIAFEAGNPFLLTVEGEFVVKNLVLLAAGLVVASTVRPVRPVQPAPTGEAGRG